MSAAVRLERVLAPNAEVRALIEELDCELAGLCTPEQRHGLALEAIFQPHVRFFVAHGPRAYGADAPLGCGGIALFPGFAEVKRMYVRPQARGQGVAGAIMARLIAETAQAKLSCLRLETGADFAAVRFYQRWGFEPCAIFEPYASKPPHTVAASAFLEKLLP